MLHRLALGVRRARSTFFGDRATTRDVMIATLSACALGFTNGVRHAFEPDHLAAVSTLVAGEKSSRTTVRYAVTWAAGHGAMLIAVGGMLAAFRKELPPIVTDVLELAVAVALVALGVRGLRRLARPHAAADRSATHRLPFAVGMVHGLAGSGALAVLVASHVSSAAYAVGFVAIYALGAGAGMAALAGLLGIPFAKLARAPRAMTFVVAASAVVSLVVGVAWAGPIVARLTA